MPLCTSPTGPRVVGPADHSVKFSIVIPTYNESENIADMIALLSKELATSVGDSYEIIVVDDDSPDRTWEIVAALGESDPRIIAVRRTQERGLATAVVRGFQVSRGDVLGVIDGDLQHPPEVVCALWAKMNAGSDVVVASRYVEGAGVGDWSLLRQGVSRVARLIAWLLLPGVLGQITDPMSGCFMVKRSVVIGVPLNPVGYRTLVEVLGRTQPTAVSEVGYSFNPRSKGRSKANLGICWDDFIHLVKLRFRPHEPTPEPH
ncbi:MAG: polyprenol monophosphomannose synthase [Terriglobales bacterium]